MYLKILIGMLLMIGVPTTLYAAYTVNGQRVAPEMGKLLAHHGFQPGAYYIDANGNYGVSGQPPQGNFNGGPPTNWRGEPRGIRNNPYATAYVNGVKGLRVFWVYSPSIFSGAKGGSSGYYHICPGNVYYQTSEGATNVGGDRNSKGWAGMAGQSAGRGSWRVVDGQYGPLLSLNGSGGQKQVPLTTLMQGRWKTGQTTYAVEQNKASCP